MSEGMIRSCSCLRCEHSPIAFSVYVQYGPPTNLTPRIGATYDYAPAAGTVSRISNGLSGDLELEGYRRVTADYSWCDVFNNPQTATAITEQHRYYPGQTSLSSLTTSCDGLVYEFTLDKAGNSGSYLNPALYDGFGNYVGASPCLTSGGLLAFGDPTYMTNCLGVGHSAAGAFFVTVSSTATVRVDELRQHNFPSADIVIGTRTTTLSEIYTTTELRGDIDEVLALFDMAAINTTPVTLQISDGSAPAVPLTFGKEGVADVWVITVTPDISLGTVIGSSQKLFITGTNANSLIPAVRIEPYLALTINGLTFTPISSYIYVAATTGLDRGFQPSFSIDGQIAQKSWIRDDVPPGKIVFFEEAYNVDAASTFGHIWTTCGSYFELAGGNTSIKPDAVCIGLPTVTPGGMEQPPPTSPLKGFYFMEGIGTPICASPC